VTGRADNGFKDHFSGHAGAYARHRPDYPPELFAWLAARAPGRELAWDAGTGNGQAAVGLARHFRHVHATDASARQISQAREHPAVEYRVEPAEHCSLNDGSADLVTVGQAWHWFDLERFHAEVYRVARPGGLFAAWTYQLCQVSAPVDAVVGFLYQEIVGSYWPPERVHVENAYRDLSFPFREIVTPELWLIRDMDLPSYMDYLRTWSAVQRYLSARGEDPLERVRSDLEDAWGDPASQRGVRWPLVVRAGFTPKSG